MENTVIIILYMILHMTSVCADLLLGMYGKKKQEAFHQ